MGATPLQTMAGGQAVQRPRQRCGVEPAENMKKPLQSVEILQCQAAAMTAWFPFQCPTPLGAAGCHAPNLLHHLQVLSSANPHPKPQRGRLGLPFPAPRVILRPGLTPSLALALYGSPVVHKVYKAQCLHAPLPHKRPERQRRRLTLLVRINRQIPTGGIWLHRDVQAVP